MLLCGDESNNIIEKVNMNGSELGSINLLLMKGKKTEAIVGEKV